MLWALPFRKETYDSGTGDDSLVVMMHVRL